MIEYRATCAVCGWFSPTCETWTEAEEARARHERTAGEHDTWMNATPVETSAPSEPPGRHQESSRLTSEASLRAVRSVPTGGWTLIDRFARRSTHGPTH